MSDLISREALRKKLQARHDNGDEDFDKGYNIGIGTAIDLIDNAPTVEERPQGEWTIGYTAKQKKVAVCNLCNCISFQGKTNFCHNCGAKMQKGGDKE